MQCSRHVAHLQCQLSCPCAEEKSMPLLLGDGRTQHGLSGAMGSWACTCSLTGSSVGEEGPPLQDKASRGRLFQWGMLWETFRSGDRSGNTSRKKGGLRWSLYSHSLASHFTGCRPWWSPRAWNLPPEECPTSKSKPQRKNCTNSVSVGRVPSHLHWGRPEPHPAAHCCCYCDPYPSGCTAKPQVYGTRKKQWELTAAFPEL